MITRGAVDLSQWKPQDVSNLHNMSDVDSGQLAQHHTLGLGPNQAAAGNHNHDKVYTKLGYTFQASPLSAGITGAVDLYKHGNVVHCVFNLGSAAAIAGNTVLSVMPVGFRPVWFNINPRYSTGLRSSSGGVEPFYYDYAGNIVNVFAIPGGDSFYGNFTFVAG